jgi:hypothetical protein
MSLFYRKLFGRTTQLIFPTILNIVCSLSIPLASLPLSLKNSFFADLQYPSSALITFVILAAIFLFVLVGIFARGLCTSPAPTNDYLTFHIPNAVGAILGYTAVIFIILGVSRSHCLVAPILMDVSLLICGGFYQIFSSSHNNYIIYFRCIDTQNSSRIYRAVQL